MKFKSVTFDLDGTLLDTVGDLAAACRQMLEELALPARSADEIRSFVGQGMVVLVRRCLDRGVPPGDELLERAVASLKSHYAAVNGENTRIFDGVLDGLAAWQKTGLPMAVVTNKPAAFSEPLLIKTGLAHYFSSIVSGDTTPHRKPHPQPIYHACAALGTDPADNLHIGDSRHDIETARNAGCAVYCVPYGYNEGEVVKAEDCDALVADLGAALCLARAV
jgi:phosphoglycolate phosphatase